MTFDLKALREVAGKATQGVWEQDGDFVGPDEETITADCSHCRHADAAHIATFDPPTVTALLDLVERQYRMLVGFEWDSVGCCPECDAKAQAGHATGCGFDSLLAEVTDD